MTLRQSILPVGDRMIPSGDGVDLVVAGAVSGTTNTEITMSTQTLDEHVTQSRTAPVDLKLEIVVIPVADVDRSKRFYEGLGWRLDADFAHGDEWRLGQMTPPGSPCSVLFRKGFTAAAPGSAQGTFLVVDDLAAARTQMIGRGVDVGEVFHFEHDLLNARN